MYVIEEVSDQFLEVKLTGKSEANGETVLATNRPSLAGRQTNIMAGTWDTSYTCNQPLPSDVDRLQVSFYSSYNANGKPWIAIDNVEIKEVGTCESVMTSFAAESPPPPSPPPSPLQPPPEVSSRRQLQDANAVNMVNANFEVTAAPAAGWAEWAGSSPGDNGWFQTGIGITDASVHPVTLNNVWFGIVPSASSNGGASSAVSTLLKADCAVESQETGIMAMVQNLLPLYEYEVTFEVAGGGTTTTLHDVSLVHLMQTNKLTVVNSGSDFDVDAVLPSLSGLRVVSSGSGDVLMMHPQHIDGRKTGSSPTFPDGALSLDFEAAADLVGSLLTTTEHGWSPLAAATPRWQTTSDFTMASTTASQTGLYDAGLVVLVLENDCNTTAGGAQMEFSGLTVGKSYRFTVRAAGSFSNTGAGLACRANHGSSSACCGQTGAIGSELQCPATAPVCTGYVNATFTDGTCSGLGVAGELTVTVSNLSSTPQSAATYSLTASAETAGLSWDLVELDFAATTTGGYIMLASAIGSCVAVDAASLEALPMQDRFDITWNTLDTATTQCTRFQGTVAIDTAGIYGMYNSAGSSTGGSAWSSTGADTEGVVLSIYESSGTLVGSYNVFGGGMAGIPIDVELTSPTGVYFTVSDRGSATGDFVYISGGLFSCNYIHDYFHNRGPMGIDTGVARAVKTNTGAVLGETAISTVAGGVFANSWSLVTFRFTTDGAPESGGNSVVGIEVVRHGYQCLVVDNFVITPIGTASGVTAGNMDDVGSIEVWVSRNKATWGTRAAKVDTSTYTGTSIPLRLTEGVAGDPAEGRYVYIRSFESARELRIDSVDFFSLPSPTGRRLGDGNSSVSNGKPTSKPVQHQHQHPPPSTEDERRNAKPSDDGMMSDDDMMPKHNKSELEHAVKKRIYRMLNMTSEVCNNMYNDSTRARYYRRLAAQWWAQLSPQEASVACHHCVLDRPVNCTTWFSTPWGYSTGSDASEEKRRKLRETMEGNSAERKKDIEKTMGNSCCRTNLKTGKKDCGKEHCKKAYTAKMQPRIAHTLRRMHENEKAETSLSVPELVATDMVAPHLHHDPLCSTEKKRKNHGELECVARSMVKHLSDKHGFSQTELDKKLDRYGITLAQILTSQLKHMSTTGGGKASYRSDPVKAEAMAAARRKEKEEQNEQNRRRMAQGSKPIGKKVRRRVGPRGSWLKHSTVENRRRLSDEGSAGSAGSDGSDDDSSAVVRVGVAPLGDLRAIKKQHFEFAVNQSRAAKQLLRAANLGAAQHGRKPVTEGELLRSAWDASLAAEGSIFGRTRSVVGGFTRIAERVGEASNLLNKPAADRGPRKRRLAEHERAYLDGVDRKLNGRTPGWHPPQEHLDAYGWIVESVDWVHAHTEGNRVAAILEERQEALYAHIEEHGTLPVGDIDEQHRTGYTLLDMNVPPSRLGEYIRMLLPRMQNRRSRRLQQRKHVDVHEVPRAQTPGQQRKSVVGSFIDAAVNDEDPFQAAWHALQHNNHISVARRLTEGFLGGASKVLPTTPLGSKTYNGVKQDPPNLVTEFARWLVYDVALCYLYPPSNQAGGNFGDGTGIETHYSDRMCWPALPFAPPRAPTFGELVGISNDYDWNELEYEQMCNSDTVKALIGPFSGDLTSIGFLAAPYGSMLRFAEGIDSIRNLGVMTVGANHTEHDRAAAIACGFAQFGGVMWLAIVLAVLTILAATSLPCALCCLRTCRRLRRGGQRARERSDAIDLLLQNAVDNGEIVPKKPVARKQAAGKQAVRKPEEEGLLSESGSLGDRNV